MNRIHEPDDNFVFTNIALTSPTMISGGAYFIKYLHNKEPLYIQLPKCKTKQGIIKAGKKFYCDLLFTNENEEFIHWMETLETYSQRHIFNNKSKWFENDLDIHDIETSFTSSFKVFKSGKFYVLRVGIPSTLGKCSLKLFDEEENNLDISVVNEKTTVLTILEVQGIRCSTRSFQIDFEVKQMMVLKPEVIFDKCVISRKSPYTNLDKTTPEDKVNNSSTEDTEIERTDVDLAQETDVVLQRNPESSEIIEEKENDKDLSEPCKKYNKICTSPATCELQDMETLPTISDEIIEVDFPVDEIDPSNTVEIKSRTDVYYDIYREARKKAKENRKLAIMSYLEAKQIKDLYNLSSIEESDEEETLESFMAKDYNLEL